MRTIVANLKMNLTTSEIFDLVRAAAAHPTSHRVVMCPAFPYLTLVSHLVATSEVQLGAQNCSGFSAGAHTGQVSATMLHDVGCSHVIIGHSECRQAGETAALLNQKILQAHSQGLTIIYCIGETLAQREAGQTWEVLDAQCTDALPESATAENTLLAYEPVWAIGTGRVAAFEDVQDACAYLGERYKMPILYGGSVTADSATALSQIPQLAGFLVGSASLSAPAFTQILDRTHP